MINSWKLRGTTGPRAKNVVNLDDPRSILLPTTCAAGAAQDQHQFSSTPLNNHPPLPDKASWTWRYSALQRDSPSEAILEGKVTTPINHHKLHFLACFAFGSPRPASAHGSHGPRYSNSKFQKALCSTLDACNILYQWPQALNRNINQTCRIRGTQQRKLQQLSRILYHTLTASWHTLMKSRPRAAPHPQWRQSDWC